MVSVIIPIYKVERYLKRCIDSVISQTYKNLEIILIDDGSPDGCGMICEEYAQKDRRIHVIHKENGGLSSARNTGINMSTGQYIAFIDSDDWVDKEYIEKLRDSLIKNTADMAACLFCRTKSENPKRQFISESIEIITENKFFDVLSEKSYAGYVCNKLFKREIIISNHLRFDEKIFNGEDFPFTLEYVQYVNKVAFIKQDLYFYFSNENGIMNTIRLNERFLTILYAREKALNFLLLKAPNCYDICNASYLSILSKTKYMSMVNLNKYGNIYKQVNEKIKVAKKGLLFLKHVGLKDKIKLLIMIYFPRISAKAYQRKVRLVV